MRLGRNKDEKAEAPVGDLPPDPPAPDGPPVPPELERVGEKIADAQSEEEVAAALDGLTNEQAIEAAGGLAPAGMQVQLPMMAIPLEGVRVSVGPGPDGAKMLVVGPVAFEFHAPLDSEGAKTLVRGLTGVEIATSLPANLKAVKG